MTVREKLLLWKGDNNNFKNVTIAGFLVSDSEISYIFRGGKLLYISLQMNRLHGLYEPASRRMRTTLTETEPM